MTMGTPQFEKVALIGLGLIGSSLAHAIRRGNLAKEVSGYAKSEATRERARELELADVCDSAADAAEGADLVIVCVPVGACGAVAQEISGALAPGAIVSDVGSVKGAVVRDMGPHIPDHAVFIPGHPIAGTEQSGPDAGFAELFDNRWCILTPLEETPAESVEKLKHFWQGCGSMVEIMAPDRHDLVLAITSHVPHLIAYNIVGTASDLETVTHSEVIKFSAAGFRDFTRIAASDPVMWRDVFLNNKTAVLEMLGRFNEDLIALQRSIRWEDGDALLELFTRTRKIRRGIIEAGQDDPGPDFGRSH